MVFSRIGWFIRHLLKHSSHQFFYKCVCIYHTIHLLLLSSAVVPPWSQVTFQSLISHIFSLTREGGQRVLCVCDLCAWTYLVFRNLCEQRWFCTTETEKHLGKIQYVCSCGPKCGHLPAFVCHRWCVCICARMCVRACVCVHHVRLQTKAAAANYSDRKITLFFCHWYTFTFLFFSVGSTQPKLWVHFIAVEIKNTCRENFRGQEWECMW